MHHVLVLEHQYRFLLDTNLRFHIDQLLTEMYLASIDSPLYIDLDIITNVNNQLYESWLTSPSPIRLE